MAIDFDRLLMTAAERGGSDLHLKSGAPPILRIHGRLLPQADFGVVAVEDMDVFARKMLPERSYNQLREGKEIDTGYAVRNVDRKSTRLNSSHLVISYAVFCLKKKNYYHRSSTDGRCALGRCGHVPLSSCSGRFDVGSRPYTGSDSASAPSG